MMDQKITSVRDCVAHMLQLCEYVLDANNLMDISVLKKKAEQVRQVLMEKNIPS